MTIWFVVIAFLTLLGQIWDCACDHLVCGHRLSHTLGAGLIETALVTIWFVVSGFLTLLGQVWDCACDHLVSGHCLSHTIVAYLGLLFVTICFIFVGA